jgi:hypothetical protein
VETTCGGASVYIANPIQCNVFAQLSTTGSAKGQKLLIGGKLSKFEPGNRGYFLPSRNGTTSISGFWDGLFHVEL